MSHQTIIVVAAAILFGNRCLIGRRPFEGSFGGMWEFPGGKVEAGEAPTVALNREIREELGLDVWVGDLLGRGTAQGRSGLIQLDVYQARAKDISQPLFCREHLDLRFVTAQEMDDYTWAPADIAAIEQVKQRLLQAKTTPLPAIHRTRLAGPGSTQA